MDQSCVSFDQYCTVAGWVGIGGGTFIQWLCGWEYNGWMGIGGGYNGWVGIGGGYNGWVGIGDGTFMVGWE